MINIHTELIKYVQDKIISSDDFFILLCITKRINRKNESFPSILTLGKESNFGRKKVIKCLSNLVNVGLIKKEQRHVKGRLSSNLYSIKTSYLSVFVNVKDEILEEEIQCTQNGHTEEIQCTQNEHAENEHAENDTRSINQSIEVLINSIEVIEKEKSPAQNFKKKQKRVNEFLELIEQPRYRDSQAIFDLFEAVDEAEKTDSTVWIRFIQFLRVEIKKDFALKRELQKVNVLRDKYKHFHNLEAKQKEKTKIVDLDPPTPSYVREIGKIKINN